MESEIEPMYVECGRHGKRIASVVCCHLLKNEGNKVGFVENHSHPNDLQAWCERCEKVFEEEGGMTNIFKEFNGMTIVCVDCYSKSKAYHSL
ncbi:MAG: hypothetical protein JJ895_12820 [Balneolaceae bacterium]|nr:hypothetical protein [Balneolaceae bacterium]